MEITGISAVEIAKAVGIQPKTLSGWRGRDDYWAHVDGLMAERDAEIIREVRRTRAKAMSVVNMALSRASRVLHEDADGPAPSPTEVSTLGKMALDVFRTTSDVAANVEPATAVPVPDFAEMLAALAALPPGLRHQIASVLMANAAVNEPVT